MEQFFTPTSPLRGDILEDSDGDHVECYEVQLAVSVEDFLVCIWDWKDLRAFLLEVRRPKFSRSQKMHFLLSKMAGMILILILI